MYISERFLLKICPAEYNMRYFRLILERGSLREEHQTIPHFQNWILSINCQPRPLICTILQTNPHFQNYILSILCQPLPLFRTILQAPIALKIPLLSGQPFLLSRQSFKMGLGGVPYVVMLHRG